MVVPDLPCLEDSLPDDCETAGIIVGAIDDWMHLAGCISLAIGVQSNFNAIDSS